MSKGNLKEDLNRLRLEVNQIADNKPDTKNKLITLINNLEQHINSESDNNDVDLLENIRDHISNFEAEHPRATAILNDIMVTLSNMGI
ncbi:MAG: DUF4404 family protein [Gammaproteobacteria bacterium]|jgi:hypothetical protein